MTTWREVSRQQDRSRLRATAYFESRKARVEVRNDILVGALLVMWFATGLFALVNYVTPLQ